MKLKELMNVKEDSTLRVWWNSNGETTYYYITDIKQAQTIRNVLAIRELDDESIAFNASGVEVFEDGEWNEWYSDEGLDVDEYFEGEEE